MFASTPLAPSWTFSRSCAGGNRVLDVDELHAEALQMVRDGARTDLAAQHLGADVGSHHAGDRGARDRHVSHAAGERDPLAGPGCGPPIAGREAIVAPSLAGQFGGQLLALVPSGVDL